MNIFMLQIVYTQPSYSFLFLLVAAVVILYIGLWRYRKRVQERFGLEKIIRRIAPLRNETFFWLKVLCLAQCFFFGSLALMQPILHLPQEKKAADTIEEEKLQESYDELVFLVDVSASMSAQDAGDHEARLSRAKEIIQAVVEHAGGTNISLYGFAGTCENEVPATMDYLYFRILLEALRLNATHIAGTNFAALLDALEKKYLKNKSEKKTRCILLTDGEDTTFLDLGSQGKNAAEKKLLERFSAFKKAGIVWDVVGLGANTPTLIPGVKEGENPVYSTMQSDFIKKIASSTAGHYYFDNALSFSRIVDGLVTNSARIEEDTGHEEEKEPSAPLFAYPLFAAFLFLTLAIILPERVGSFSMR